MRWFSLSTFLLCTLATLGFSSTGKAANLTFEVRSHTDIAWAGEHFGIQLVLKGPGIFSIVSKTEGLLLPDKKDPYPDHNTADRFVLHFEIKPDKPGKMILGPYEMEVMGQKLRSNQLTITVMDVTPGPNAIVLSADNPTVKVGQTFQLILVSESDVIYKVSLKDNARFKTKSQAFSSSSYMVGDQLIRRFSLVIVIQPLKKGLLRFGHDNLNGVPVGTEVNEVSVEVKQ